MEYDIIVEDGVGRGLLGSKWCLCFISRKWKAPLRQKYACYTKPYIFIIYRVSSQWKGANHHLALCCSRRRRMLHTPLLTTAQTSAAGDPEPPATATVNTPQFGSRQLSLTVLQPPLPMTARTTMNSWGDMRAFTTRWDVGDQWHHCCFWTCWIFCENPLHQKKRIQWREWSSWQQLSVWTKCADSISFWWFYLFAWWTCMECLTDWFCFILLSPVECFYRHVQQKEAFVSFKRW